MKRILILITTLLVCTICLISCEMLKLHSHEFGEWETTVSPTCSREGEQERYCECGEVETRAIISINHFWRSATCTLSKTCIFCQATEGTPLGHDWTEATCTFPKKCLRCYLTEGEKLPHNYGEWQLNVKPKCESQGEIIRICSACDGIEKITVVPNGHNYVKHECTICKCSEAGLYNIDCDFTDWSTLVSSKKIEISSDTTIIKCSDTIEGKLVIPSGITSFFNSAFQRCDFITEIILPNSIAQIPNSAFMGCSELKTLIFNGTVDEWNSITKGDNWNIYIPATEVVCSNGIVPLSEISEGYVKPTGTFYVIGGKDGNIDELNNSVIDISEYKYLVISIPVFEDEWEA